ncbi:peptidylprolyl isomerase [candidate division KSB1 bacterium]|nr:peptidylprolyl isomerase [candidate division KSB1 bacterium]
MRSVSYKSLFLNFLLLGVVIFFVFRCKNGSKTPASNVLAIVGKKSIDKENFIKRFKDYQQQTGIPDNGLTRRNLLSNLVLEELLIVEAYNRDYDDDKIGKQEFERIKVQELLNAYHDLFIRKNVTTTDKELKQLYVNLNTKINARHIYAPTKNKADSLYNLLKQGIPFEEIAKFSFADPLLQESGGSLGYFSVDEMEAPFEEAAFVLKIGEISKPVKTNDGYSIIRVDDRISQPFPTETEFAKHRHKLKRYWLKRKIHKATKNHSDSLRKVLNITFNEQVVSLLFKSLNQKEQTLNEALENSEQVQPDLKNEELLSSKMGFWSIKKFREYAKFTSMHYRDMIRSENKLKDFIAGLVIRSFMLDKAKELKLHKKTEYKIKVSDEFDTWLLGRVKKDVSNEFIIPEDSLKKYFDEAPEIFVEPAKIRLKEIVLRGEENVEMITSNLKKGVSFSTLAKKYSVNKDSAEKGGDLGFWEAQQLGPQAKEILAMKIGGWSGPHEMNSYFVFLKCADKIPSQPRNYAQAQLDVEETVRSLWRDRIIEDKVKEISVTTTVASFPKKLRTIKIN